MKIGEEWQFDGLVPVPVHPARKRKRGFNQAEVLAKRMGERLEMPVCPGIFISDTKYRTPERAESR